MKRQINFKKILSLLFCLVLIAAIALGTTACDNKNGASSSAPDTSYTASDTVKTVGEGTTEFSLLVTDKDGNSTAFKVKTDKKTVGDALLDLKLIDGEEGQYGLYIKSVNGITADYDIDGTYWAFYVNGEYASTGVDTTEITEGTAYSLKVEK